MFYFLVLLLFVEQVSASVTDYPSSLVIGSSVNISWNFTNDDGYEPPIYLSTSEWEAASSRKAGYEVISGEYYSMGRSFPYESTPSGGCQNHLESTYEYADNPNPDVGTEGKAEWTVSKSLSPGMRDLCFFFANGFVYWQIYDPIQVLLPGDETAVTTSRYTTVLGRPIIGTPSATSSAGKDSAASDPSQTSDAAAAAASFSSSPFTDSTPTPSPGSPQEEEGVASASSSSSSSPSSSSSTSTSTNHTNTSAQQLSPAALAGILNASSPTFSLVSTSLVVIYRRRQRHHHHQQQQHHPEEQASSDSSDLSAGAAEQPTAADSVASTSHKSWRGLLEGAAGTVVGGGGGGGGGVEREGGGEMQQLGATASPAAVVEGLQMADVRRERVREGREVFELSAESEVGVGRERGGWRRGNLFGLGGERRMGSGLGVGGETVSSSGTRVEGGDERRAGQGTGVREAEREGEGEVGVARLIWVGGRNRRN